MEQRFRTFALLTFVTDVEKEQILSLFDWEVLNIRHDNGTYYNTVIVRDGIKLPIVAVWQREKGSIASATLVMKCIDLFHPEYVISGGIAAGVRFKHKDEQPKIGDVVISDSTWNLSKGKYADRDQTELSEGNIGYIPRPTMTYIHDETRKMLMRLSKNPENPVRTHIGTYLSSGSVIANSHFMQKAVLSSNLIAKALDMESFGIAYACEMANPERPTPIIAKGISDFADEGKSDEYQALAAENSAIFINYLLMHLPYDNCFRDKDKKKSSFLFSELQSAVGSIRNLIERKARDTSRMQQMKGLENELDFFYGLKSSLYAPTHYDDEHITFDALHISDNIQEFSYYGCRRLNDHLTAINMTSPIGKGIPSCFLMPVVQNCFEAFMNAEATLEDVVGRTNQFLSSANFMHVLYESLTCIIDSRDSSIHYINSGHSVPFVIRSDGSIEDVTGGHDNPKLGLKDAVFTESCVSFKAGESLFLFSGGVEECRNAEGEVYGRKRLKRLLRENIGKPADVIQQSLRQSLTEFSGKDATDRDWAMIRVCFIP